MEYGKRQDEGSSSGSSPSPGQVGPQQSPVSSTVSSTAASSAGTTTTTTDAAVGSSGSSLNPATLVHWPPSTPTGLTNCTPPLKPTDQCILAPDKSTQTHYILTGYVTSFVADSATTTTTIWQEQLMPEPTSSGSSSSQSSEPLQSSTSSSHAGAPSGTGTTTQPKASAKGPSTGAVAGAAVGCFILGALAAALVAFFLSKKRSNRNRRAARTTYIPGPEPRYGGEKGTPLVSVAPVGALDFLPQQADDAEVQRKLSTIIDQIDQHVENFYSSRKIPLDANLETELSRFETSQLTQPLAACFEHSANPEALIKHCLAFHIFNLTVAPGEGTQPLLPPELAGTIAATYNKSLSASASKDTLTAFSSWKALTKYLRPDLMRDPTASRSATENTARIASHFTHVFSPWSNPQYSDEHRTRHLTELINHAIQTAIWLFGQPDGFRFDWATPALEPRQATASRGTNSVVIVPAVFKVTHNGTKLGGKGQSVLSSIVKRY